MPHETELAKAFGYVSANSSRLDISQMLTVLTIGGLSSERNGIDTPALFCIAPPSGAGTQAALRQLDKTNPVLAELLRETYEA